MVTLENGFDHKDAVRKLFGEYTKMLVDTDPTFAEYLVLQSYEDELRHLEDKYGEPRGRLWIALSDGEAAGCIALRALDDRRCEMKRLYVRPAFRGLGIGALLTDTAISAAREIGYRHMLLDTLPPLTAAIAMYRTRGFYEIPCYNNSPVEKTIFLQLDL